MVRFALLALVLVSASACEGGASKAKEAVKKVDKVADKLDTDEAGAHLTAAGQAFANGKEAPEACSWASSSAASNVAESARGSVEQLRKMCAVEPPLIRAAAAATRRALLGLVDAQRTAVDVLAVDLVDRLLGLIRGAHRHEREAARTAGLAIEDDVDVRDLTVAREELADGVAGGVEGKVAYVQSGAHGSLACISTIAAIPSCSVRRLPRVSGAP